MLQHKNAGPVITHDAVVKADTVAAVKAGAAENEQESQLQVTAVPTPTAEPTEATEAEAPSVEIESDAIAETGAAVRLGRS